VPKEQWYAAPAQPESPAQPGTPLQAAAPAGDGAALRASD
jgi:hypothetical protein